MFWFDFFYYKDGYNMKLNLHCITRPQHETLFGTNKAVIPYTLEKHCTVQLYIPIFEKHCTVQLYNIISQLIGKKALT